MSALTTPVREGSGPPPDTRSHSAWPRLSGWTRLTPGRPSRRSPLHVPPVVDGVQEIDERQPGQESACRCRIGFGAPCRTRTAPATEPTILLAKRDRAAGGSIRGGGRHRRAGQERDELPTLDQGSSIRTGLIPWAESKTIWARRRVRPSRCCAGPSAGAIALLSADLRQPDACRHGSLPIAGRSGSPLLRRRVIALHESGKRCRVHH